MWGGGVASRRRWLDYPVALAVVLLLLGQNEVVGAATVKSNPISRYMTQGNRDPDRRPESSYHKLAAKLPSGFSNRKR